MHQTNVNNKIQYNSHIDKSEIPTCEIIGVHIAAINMKWLMEFLANNLRGTLENILAGQYICVCNVHATVMANEDSEYRRIQNESLMSIPDGGPLSTIGRRRGHKNMERTTGPDLMEEVFKQSVENEYKHYFYGSTEDTLKKMNHILQRNYPGIQIVGMYSPPFSLLEPKKEEEIIKEINRTNPDFIWVGLGAPKQERWMASQQGKVNGLMIGVGAGFDYVATNIKRAPIWMQKYNMEWFYRLIQEPKRLFKRYVVTNIKFIYYVILDSFSKG
ncbi:WecB/TagA/CpsF family glycosyltransferase [Solibacillus sp. FSL K6-1523]|uniref:WecB/TagA/CpsF family glycosyltransferase n=1 Tax=Solibacillus sp. FSL K6-1523 TaxID=2921471 RepID=UPI0030F82DEC